MPCDCGCGTCETGLGRLGLMKRVKSPGLNRSLGEVVLDASVASDAFGFSPYSPVVDYSGTDAIAKVDEFSEVVPPSGEGPLLPLGAPIKYDSLVGLTLTNDQIINVYEAIKQGNSAADVALAFDISQEQAEDIFQALLSGATPDMILNPEVAQYDANATYPIRTLNEDSYMPYSGGLLPPMIFAQAGLMNDTATTAIQENVPAPNPNSPFAEVAKVAGIGVGIWALLKFL